MTLERRHKKDVPARAVLGFFKALIDCGRERASFPELRASTAPELLFWVMGKTFPWWLILDDGKPAGCAWITDILGTCGRCHFAFLPGPDPVPLGRFILSSVLHDRDPGGRFLVDTLVGVTPAANRGAVSLAGRCGAVVLGEIPGFHYIHDTDENQPAVIAWYTRDRVPAEWGEHHGR
jgi:hypothetical protein